MYNLNAVFKYFKFFSTPITKIVVNGDKMFVASAKNSSILNIKVLHSEDSPFTSQIKDEFN